MDITATVEVSRVEAQKLILDNKGKFFGVIFVRKNPKCLKCEKKFKDNKTAPAVCGCGGEVSFVRKASGLLGVRNPTSGATIPGQGLYEGESFEEALSKGRVKYYDANVQQAIGKGDYRQFYVSLVVEVCIGGIRYKVLDA